MAILKTSIPYAKALFELAKEKNMVTDIKSDTQSLVQAIDKSTEFADFISNPIVSSTDKTTTLAKLFGGKIKTETSNFLNILVSKGRISELKSVCEAFQEMANKESNTYQLKLTTATHISDDAKKQIAEKSLGDAKFEIETIVNPEILGGFILEYDNRMLDQSISTKVNTFKKNILK
jgi:F-type H+-transporting ATPase subunit delta